MLGEMKGMKGMKEIADHSKHPLDARDDDVEESLHYLSVQQKDDNLTSCLFRPKLSYLC